MTTHLYEGSCHCGAVRFRFRSEPLTRGFRCNCSICTCKGSMVSPRYYPPEDFELLSGTGALRLYQFGDRMVNHWFCGTCGIHPFHDATGKPGHYRVNLNCVAGVDTQALAVEHLDGRSF